MKTSLDVMKLMAHEAGVVLLRHYGSISSLTMLDHDVVTIADLESERRIISLIEEYYPQHNINAEESGKKNRGSEYTWILDPLDGTRNYVMDIPFFSVAIALEKSGEIIQSAILNPVTKELFVAELGSGAYLNGNKIRVSQKSEINQSTICCDWGSMTPEHIQQGISYLSLVALHSCLVVVNFCPSLNLCRVAQGKAEAFISNGTYVEDHAAGSLILTEAGGGIRNFADSSWNLYELGLVATNRFLDEQISKLLKVIPNI